ncbi:pullulanase [Undibacterium sp. GrIS 1.2]|uniref:alpha-1,6-glucosidase domain-containing protein n=1 Tax=Undibacterium sp. GrIS 1.2 TaxID=3143933 RepID=UPI00339265A2
MQLQNSVIDRLNCRLNGRLSYRLKMVFITLIGLGLMSACGGSNEPSANTTSNQNTVVSAATLSVNAANGNPALSIQATAKLGQPAASAPAPVAGIMRMHYHRAEHDTVQWGVYSWDGPLVPSQTWITDRFMMTNADSFGGYVDIPVNTTKTAIWFLVTDGSGNKNCGNDQHADFYPTIASTGQEIWMLEGDCTVYASPPPISFGNLNNATALWLAPDTIAWPGAGNSNGNGNSGSSYKLFYAANGGLGSNASGVTGADGSISLMLNSTGLSSSLRAKFPYVSSATALNLSAGDAANVIDKMTAQFAIAQYDSSGNLVQVTSLQMAGMLDALYAAKASNAELGLSFNRFGTATFRLWAPTAKSVKLNLYPDADMNHAAAIQVDLTKDAASGVWTYVARDPRWTNRWYYTYTVNVLSRWASNTVVSNVVTDPYSLSLNANGQRSFIVNLDSPEMKPHDWDYQRIPELESVTDIALYELHIRDFSANDATVPAAHRGKFLAFTDTRSNGMRHLKSLQRAGMTHIHLLPSFDIASVSETGCTNTVIPNAPADSTAQQAAVAANQDGDCFNWGYDPVHYSAPDGSYATNANDGAVRVKEFRAMVRALHEEGLRVTMDVVYNHTSQAQQGPLSVLDKIVPAYYYRLNANGGITNDSCCSDTAAENAMMGKLMIDSVISWAKHYKVDSFRFDIMGMHPLPLISKLQTEVNQAAHRTIYLYGEAWNFGVIANDARFVQARQANLFGSGIGSFNDRLRDAVRGGGCCDSGNNLISQQGFINGAFYDPNAQSTQTKDDLLRVTDLVRVGLSGTLRDYRFTDRTGINRKNSEMDYFGMPAGYTANPGESINYIEAHDNQTLFDLNAYKLPVTTNISDRVRVQNLGAAITLLSQGVPFIHAGQDLLRSKSLDQNSYNAGDWFNQLDFTYQSNHFGIGLPMAASNQANWPLMSPILTNPLINPGPAAIKTARDYFADMLAIRNDTSLFRLRTGQDVIDRLSFYNVGPQQQTGLIAMGIDGQYPRRYSGAKYKQVVVLFNVDKVAKNLTIEAMRGRSLTLHPIQRQSDSDAVARTATFDRGSGAFSVPPRTTVVFVEY